MASGFEAATIIEYGSFNAALVLTCILIVSISVAYGSKKFPTLLICLFPILSKWLFVQDDCTTYLKSLPYLFRNSGPINAGLATCVAILPLKFACCITCAMRS